jgi:hypothetical protein
MKQTAVPTTALVRRTDVLRAQLRTLLLVAESATPGPWDARSGCVVSTSAPITDLESADYYGGELVGESMHTADALLVACARNMVPDLARAHLGALEEIDQLRRDVRFAVLRALDRCEVADLAHLLDAIGYRVALVPRRGLVEVRP